MVEFARLANALDGNPALQRRARLAALAFKVRSGEQVMTVQVGEKIAVSSDDGLAAAFTLAAAPASWDAFAQAVPPVGFQSLVAMQRMGHLSLHGEVLAWGRNLLFLEQLFGALRPPSTPEPIAPVGTPAIEPIVGRYLRLDFKGQPHRIYFEEAGQGMPLLCLHTAGA